MRGRYDRRASTLRSYARTSLPAQHFHVAAIDQRG
jgi:hypothetical protein